MEISDELRRRKIADVVYGLVMGLLLAFIIFYSITQGYFLKLTSFDSWVPLILLIISFFCILLNRWGQWILSKSIFISSWITLVNILPPFMVGVSPNSYIVHPVLCIISSLMIHLFFSFYSEKWVFVFLLLVSFLLTTFSFDFLVSFDTQSSFADLPLNPGQLRFIFVNCWIFVNLSLIYVYRISWKIYKKLEEKNEIIERMNHDLEARVEKRTAQLQERNERLRAYAFTNAHIIRAPVSRILGLLNLMHRSENPAEAQEIKRYLEESATELDRVIRQSSIDLEKDSDEDASV
jgi:signal transduction histidine kinase